MKTKIKRHSRAVLAVVLTLCMLVSCMTVGIIATDAAKTAGQRVGAMADDEALGDGDTTYYMHIGAGSAFRTTSGNAFTYDSTNSYYYYDYAITANTEYVFVINTTSGTLGDGNKSSSTQTVTTLASSWNATGASFDYNSYGSNNYDGYDAFKFKCKSDITIRFTFTSTFSDGVTYRLSSGGGGGDEPAASDTIYFDKSELTDWSTVYAYLYTSSYWNANGSGSSGRSNGVEMTYDSALGLYKTSIASDITHVVFLKDRQNGYGNFHQTEAVYIELSETYANDSKFSAETPVYVPDSTKNIPINSTRYYDTADTNHGSWVSATSPVASSLAISASPTELTAVDQTSTITVTATNIASDVTNLTYTIYDRANNNPVGDPVTVTNGATSATFTVTPNARVKSYYASVKPTTSEQQALYDEVWTSTDATITNSADAYIPSYTVNFSSNNDSYGTVTAKDASGNAITSGASIKEGESVTFTATPKTGNVFTGWSQFDTKSSSVTRVIRADTTATGNFGPKGYKVLAGSNSTNDMKELANGTYISTVTYNHGAWFEIVSNATGQTTVASENTQGVTTNTKYKVTSWADGTEWRNSDVFKIYDNIGDGYYIVYDPSTDEIWITKDQDDLYGVTVIAKDGSIRYGYEGTYSSDYGDTTLSAKLGDGTEVSSGNAYDSQARSIDFTANQVREGITLHVTTRVKSDYVSQGYYVKGFVVTGYEESFSVLWQDEDQHQAWINDGYNEFDLTLPEYPAKNVEITPVYWIKETNSGDNVRFYVDGFAGDVYDAWDGNLAIEAYKTNGTPVLGEYPGQPMINYNGRYVVDLPRTDLGGITLNNYVWDRVHSNMFYGTSGTANPDTTNQYLNKIQAANKQTYDFNDFIYIKQALEEDTDPTNDDEDIIFSFRYKYDTSHNTLDTSNHGKLTYYKDSDAAGKPPVVVVDTTYDYEDQASTLDVNNSIYQWENLTDFYQNRVDILGNYVDTKNQNGTSTNPKAAYTNPVRIVSNGYDFSEAGKYATAWAIYVPVDGSNNLAPTGAYHHYQLVEVFGGQGKVTTENNQKVGKWGSSSYLVNPAWTTSLKDKYDYAYSTDTSKPHSDSSFVYDLAKMPTVISYEYSVNSNKSNLNLEGAGNAATDGNPGLRSDGRWYATNSNQLLKAHTIIEYAERDEESLYHRDYYQGGGIDYTSSSGYDPTKNTGLATGIKAYFENDDTVPYMGQDHQNTSGNTQAYAMSDGDHEFLLKAEDDPNGEYVFKGWYMYTNGKYSLVSRSQTYPSEATANDVYVARFYKAPAGTLNITHDLDSSSNGNADCYTKVEVLNSSGTVIDSTSFPRTTGSIKVLTNYIKCTSTNKLRITIDTVPDEYGVLNGFNENISGTLRELTQANVRLAIPNATVTPNISDKTATITFDIKELFSSTDPAEAVQNIKSIPLYSIVNEYTYKIDYTYPSRLYGNQTYTAEGKILATEYSDSTKRDPSTDLLTGAFVQSKQVYEDNFMKDMTWNYNNITTDKSEYKYTAAITANQPETAPTKNLQFNFPYEYQSTTIGGKTIYTAKEACPTYDTNQQDPSQIAVPYMEVYYGEQKVDNETKYYFTQAPASVKVGSTIYPFQYWSLEVNNKEVARCYSRNFNFAMFNNYTVTPIFSNTGSGAIGSDTAATITFLEYSRNQWNYDQKGTRSTSKTAMDTVYADFDLSFTNKGELIDASSATEVGVIIENLGKLTEDGSGGYVTDMATYSDRTQYKNDLKTFINAGGTDAAKTTYLAATGNTSQNVTKRAINKSILTNKNRTEYYLGINASENGEDTNNRTSLYRIYSYIKNGSTVTLSDPVYINIYAEASK